MLRKFKGARLECCEDLNTVCVLLIELHLSNSMPLQRPGSNVGRAFDCNGLECAREVISLAETGLGDSILMRQNHSATATWQICGTRLDIYAKAELSDFIRGSKSEQQTLGQVQPRGHGATRGKAITIATKID